MTARSAKPKPKPRVKWTKAAIVGLGVLTDLRTFGSIFGMSETAAREAFHAGRLPEPVVVIRAGRRLVVPVAPILAALGLGPSAYEDRQQPADQQPSQAGEQPAQAMPAPGSPGPP
jgi:hypothetical protein